MVGVIYENNGWTTSPLSKGDDGHHIPRVEMQGNLIETTRQVSQSSCPRKQSTHFFVQKIYVSLGRPHRVDKRLWHRR
jgi:hypothetical protein